MIFIDNKYTKIYFQIINRAKPRKTSEYTENHHIIPDCFFKNRKRKGKPGWIDGNPEDKNNKVQVTGQEHFICHWLLIKMTSGDGHISMVHAFMCMTAKSKKQARYNGHVNGKMYSYLRKINAEEMRKQMKNRVRSPETIDKWRKSRAWYKSSSETKQKISNALSGVKKPPFTEEHRKNIGLGGIGRKPWNKGISTIPWNKGIKGSIIRTEESRIKQSAAQAGRSWWNNGTQQTLAKTCPEGYFKGRMPNKKNR